MENLLGEAKPPDPHHSSLYDCGVACRGGVANINLKILYFAPRSGKIFEKKILYFAPRSGKFFWLGWDWERLIVRAQGEKIERWVFGFLI